jgi:hypothetical protein
LGYAQVSIDDPNLNLQGDLYEKIYADRKNEWRQSGTPGLTIVLEAGGIGGQNRLGRSLKDLIIGPQYNKNSGFSNARTIQRLISEVSG